MFRITPDKIPDSIRSRSGRQPRKHGRLCSCGGFTMVELIVIIIMVGIVTATVAMKYGSFSASTNLRMAIDQVAADLRFIQCRAMAAYSGTPSVASRSATFLNGANTYNLGGQIKSLPSGVSINNTSNTDLTVTFNSLGEYNTTIDAALTLNFHGSTATGSVKISAISGNVEAY